MIRRRLLFATTVATGTLALALASCTSTVPLTPAPEANSLSCADVAVRLPDTVGELERRWTNAQATGAWGEPTAAVVFTCGLEPPSPTTLQCVTISGIDWIVDETESPSLRLTTYGREPAAQAVVDTTIISADEVLKALSSSVQQLPASTSCTDADTEADIGEDPAATGEKEDGR